MQTYKQVRSKYEARRRVLRQCHELREAQLDWAWNYETLALRRLRWLFMDVIDEPLEGTKEFQEYLDGKRQQETQEDEQEAEPEEGLVPAEGRGPIAERDDDGYLIR